MEQETENAGRTKRGKIRKVREYRYVGIAHCSGEIIGRRQRPARAPPPGAILLPTLAYRLDFSSIIRKNVLVRTERIIR